jgi:hypothetical protein
MLPHIQASTGFLLFLTSPVSSAKEFSVFTKIQKPAPHSRDNVVLFRRMPTARSRTVAERRWRLLDQITESGAPADNLQNQTIISRSRAACLRSRDVLIAAMVRGAVRLRHGRRSCVHIHPDDRSTCVCNASPPSGIRQIALHYALIESRSRCCHQVRDLERIRSISSSEYPVISQSSGLHAAIVRCVYRLAQYREAT